PSLGYVAKRLGKNAKIISILDNVIPHEKRMLDETFTRYFLKRNHGFVVMSDVVQNDLLKFMPDAKYVFREHPLFSHFGEKLPKTEARKKLGIKENSKLLLFFGLIREYKGLDILIDAFGKLDESYELLIAGEAYTGFEKYQRLIDESPMKKNIHLFNRYILDQEVPLFFSAADVSVLPYRSATQSGITSISFHFELPVIATDVGGLKEIVQHGKYGLVVQNGDPKEISESIKNYFDNNLKSKFANEIIQKKIENSWSNFADKIIEFHQSL
ncbi:MAG: glycosyltransferase, partial [Bacteroidota bacterium]